jgi:hypothetical protein
VKTHFPIILGLVLVSTLSYFAADHYRVVIETDLVSRTQAALSPLSIPKAGITADGQVVYLRGEVASEDIKRKAEAEASRLEGVAEVRNMLRVITTASSLKP